MLRAPCRIRGYHNFGKFSIAEIQRFRVSRCAGAPVSNSRVGALARPVVPVHEKDAKIPKAMTTPVVAVHLLAGLKKLPNEDHNVCD
jgi:hypothetical protein